MKKIIFLFVLSLLFSGNLFGQVKDYELGADLVRGKGNYSGGYFNYSEPTSINIKVSVWGFVKYPGRYFVPINTTVTDLLSYAGGPSDDAHTDQLRLYRVLENGTNELHTFSYDDIMWGDSLLLKQRNIPSLYASDILVVPGSQRLYFKDWASLSLSLLSVLISLTTLILITGK
ncbi:MAG: SLBB domain-containing protein [Melioribacteraceae bacterium]|nr:SLBB domain-containing protein [Melioribacteraceae bacterium]